MSTSKINQAEWDALFASFGAALDAFEQKKRNTEQELANLDDLGIVLPTSDDYEAAIRMSPHPECCACSTCELKHRYEEEA